MNAIYPTDLSDTEWECLTRHLPAKRPRGRPCGHPLRAILDAIFSLLRTGCPWRVPSVPGTSRPGRPSTTISVASALMAPGTSPRALRTAERRRVGKQPQPSGGDHGRAERQDGRGIGPDQRLRRPQARQGAQAGIWHMLVDTLGLPISISVTPADTHDKVGAWRLLAGLKPLVPRLAKIWADGAYTSQKLARWCKGYGGWDLEIVGRDPEAQGFAVQPRRWVVERGSIRLAGAQPAPADRL